MHFSSLYWTEATGSLGGKKYNLEKLSFLSSHLSHVSSMRARDIMFCSLLYPQSPLQWLHRMGLLEMPISPSPFQLFIENLE